MNLSELQRLLDGSHPVDASAILRAAVARLRAAHSRATIALACGEGDLRPALRRLVREYAEVHGRTAAQQVQAFCDERNALFLDLSFRAWGIALEA